MGQRIQQSFLGEAAQRLARALGLDGLISPQFDSQERIIPVALVADGTVPGSGDHRGRRWAGGTILAGGAQAPRQAFKATEDVVITALQFSSQTAGECTISYLGADEVEPWAIATQGPIFLDRARSAGEFAPVLSGGDAAGVAFGGRIIWRSTILINTPYVVLITPFLLTAGAKICLTAAVTATADFNIAGYRF